MVKGKYKRTPETLKKLSDSHKGKKLSRQTKEKISLAHKGKKLNDSTKEKLSEIHKGKHYSLETEFKKGQKVWNYEHGEKCKRRFKKFNGKSILRSHYVFCKHNNILEIPKGYVIHHKDHNSLNDDIGNLILMTDKAHRRLHLYISKLKAGDKLI